MKKFLFEIIMSKACNKRCEYCKLDFESQNISNDSLDSLINILKWNKNSLDNVIINFFGWEPLLNFSWIKYFVNKTKNFDCLDYSIWTNWSLLDEEKLNFLIKNKFKIHLSFDSENTDTLLKNLHLKKWIDNIEVNYIINPNTIKKSFNDFDKLISFWFKNINVMPVYFTLKWNKGSFVILNQLLNKKIKKYIWENDYSINFYSYYNWVSSDTQYILESDWTLYSDLDSLLWIQKQWWIISDILSNEIEEKTTIGKIHNLWIDDIIKKHEIKDIIKLVHEIPKEQGLIMDYKILDKIFNG